MNTPTTGEIRPNATPAEILNAVRQRFEQLQTGYAAFSASLCTPVSDDLIPTLVEHTAKLQWLSLTLSESLADFALALSQQSRATADQTRTVTIPTQPDGSLVAVTLRWCCPVCGEPRGDVFTTKSYEGRRPVDCDGWQNPCGHVDLYDDVWEEAQGNGLNPSATDSTDNAPQAANGNPTRPNLTPALNDAQACLLTVWGQYRQFIDREVPADITPVDCSIVIEAAEDLVAALRQVKALTREGRA